MWRRFRRRSMAPRRPVLFPEQWGVALVTGLLLVAGIALVILVLAG